MNTRKYPRTTLEAFGVDARSACAIERPRQSERIASWALAVAIGLIGAAALVAWGMEPPVREKTAEEKKAELRTQRWERAVEASFKKEGVK